MSGVPQDPMAAPGPNPGPAPSSTPLDAVIDIDYAPLPPVEAEPAPSRSRRPVAPAGRTRSKPVSVTMPARHRGLLVVLEWSTVLLIGGIAFGVLVTPAIRNASRAARTTACGGNLRRLGQTFQMYLSDYDSQYPPLPPGETLELATQPHTEPAALAWTSRLSAYREQPNPKAPQDDPFVCPAADGMPTYAYNAGLGATVFPEYEPKGRPATESTVVRPSGTLLAFDTANLNVHANNLAGYRFFYGGKNQPAFRPGDFVLPTEGVRDEWIRPRHAGDTVMAVYCDGHIHTVGDISMRLDARSPFDPSAPDH